jgi:hypothetical protein
LAFSWFGEIKKPPGFSGGLYIVGIYKLQYDQETPEIMGIIMTTTIIIAFKIGRYMLPVAMLMGKVGF